MPWGAQQGAISDPGAFLRDLFDVALARADPMQCVPPALPPRPAGRVVVLGAGKASARMAEAVESVWGPCEGLVITRYGYGRPCHGVEIVEAAHPVPDQAGVDATRRLLSLAQDLGPEDTCVMLVSGGGSALLCAPADGLTLSDKQALGEAMLASGMPIGQINAVRKEVSAVKGGRLAAAVHPGRLITLIISDVPGDDPRDIASGPTVPHPSDAARALAILSDWGIEAPPAVARFLAAGGAPQDATATASGETRICAAPVQSLEAAAAQARAAGVEVRMLGNALEGEARELARTQAALALEIARDGPDRPVLLLSGGECTVTRRGKGIGGPNAEFVLAAALALNGQPGVHVLACDTDGVDGGAEVAGALADPATLTRARAQGVSAQAELDANNAHGFFAAAGGQVITGPTLTNVNDFRAFLILP
ncbi:glycerate kinase type-2 family protein [Thalassorhabdomicrobium marinisediminis]|uniref:Glycerate kinase n=1 Tax=Thalassorhabdomicrobium marinisediminis TaxID=2170577 RepID=A0A2T7FT16_9RHOB|nr:glycerate kinase [Thalassorhabdomicrobium marinisediminis]PVA05282.1 glycerate kinase [Thalassorhabdomicrobium marinisediminis]